MAQRKITSGGIADNAIGSDQIAAGAVSVSDVADGSLTAAKLDASTNAILNDVANKANSADVYTQAQVDNAIANNQAVTTGTSEPSSPSTGDLWYDTNTGVKALKIWDGTQFIKVSIAIPSLAAATGNIFNGQSSNLTLTGTNFLLSNLVVTFTAGGTDYNVTVTPTSDTEATVAVPSGIYNQGASTLVTIKVRNTDGAESGTRSKTILALPSGGTIATSGSYRYHKFTSSGTFTNTVSGLSVEYIIVAGGGGSGTSNGAAGGGAGGLLNGTVSLTASSYPVVVGGGGGDSGGSRFVRAGNGSNSTALGYTAIGGGSSGTEGDPYSNALNEGADGGSGGGGVRGYVGGSGTTGQGNDGGDNVNDGSPHYRGGGGGGAGSAGQNGGASGGGNGGNGRQFSDWATATSSGNDNGYYAGGGAGGSYNGAGAGGQGGTPGLGQGSPYVGTSYSASQLSAPANSGGGGNGHGYYASAGGSGGSGIVIVRYQL